jgi:SAM-dependent methyltransferase
MQLTPDADFARILDFGSGTGRLSLALAPYADCVSCVDLSVTMQERLRSEAQSRGVTNLRFLSSQAPPVVGHTWAISLLTLQHVPGRDAVRAALQYIHDSLVPGGSGVVEAPAAPCSVLARLNVALHPQWRIYRAARRIGVPASWLIRHGIHGIFFDIMSMSEVTELMSEVGLTVIARDERQSKHYSFVRYGFTRPAVPAG